MLKSLRRAVRGWDSTRLLTDGRAHATKLAMPALLLLASLCAAQRIAIAHRRDSSAAHSPAAWAEAAGAAQPSTDGMAAWLQEHRARCSAAGCTSQPLSGVKPPKNQRKTGFAAPHFQKIACGAYGGTASSPKSATLTVTIIPVAPDPSSKPRASSLSRTRGLPDASNDASVMKHRKASAMG